MNTNAVIFVLAAHLHSSTCPLTGNFMLAAKKTATSELEEEHQKDAADSEHKMDIGNCGRDSSLTAGCDNTNKISLKNSCSLQKTGWINYNNSATFWEWCSFTFSFKVFQDYLMTTNFSCNSALKLIKSRILNKGPQIIHFVCLCQSFPAMTAGWRRSYLARNTTPLCLTKQAKVQGESHLSNSIKTIFPVDLWICFDIYLSLIIFIP